MKAIILCAGLGTRMRPLTDAIPKCLLPVGGRPLIHHTLEALAVAGVDEVAINLHHLPGAIVHDLKRGYRFGVRITYSFERELLGTAGAIKRLQWWLDEEPFFVVYGDEWTTIDFADLWRKHHLQLATATAVVHPVAEGAGRNLLEITADGYVTRIWPKEVRRIEYVDWALSGIYVLDPLTVQPIPEGPWDIEADLLPLLIAYGLRVRAYCVKPDVTIDIGKPEGYERAKRLAAGL